MAVLRSSPPRCWANSVSAIASSSRSCSRTARASSAVACRASGDQRVVERRLRAPDLAEESVGARDDVVCLCLPGGIAGRRQRAGGFGDQRDRLAYATRADEIGELSAERRRVSAQALVGARAGTQRQ